MSRYDLNNGMLPKKSVLDRFRAMSFWRWLSLVGLTVMLISASVPVFTFDSKNIGALFWSIAGFFLGFLIERFAQWAEADRAAEDLSKEVDAICNVVTETFNVKCLTSVDQWIQVCEELSMAAESIENTFITVSDHNQFKSRIISIYERFLSKDGTTWTDIVSRGSIFSKRFLEMRPKPKCKGVHNIYVVKNSFPIDNFTIFYLPLGRVLVVFGWSETQERVQQKVFLTEESRLCEMYMSLFKSIVTSKMVDKVIIRYDETSESKRFTDERGSVVNRKGVWYTNAYDKLHNIKRTALFGINFFQGEPSIIGLAADKEGKSDEKIAHLPETTHDSRGKIFAEYTITRDSVPSNGIVVYEFSKFGDHDTIKGYFVDPEYNPEIVEVYGIRIDHEPRNITEDAELKQAMTDWLEPTDQLYKRELSTLRPARKA